MSLYRAGLGSLLLPDKQVDRIDAMRRDTLDRVDATASKVSTAVVVGGALSALSTLVLVRSAYKMRKAA